VSADLRDAAAAILLGIDAGTANTTDFQPEELVYDPSGKRLLMARSIPENRKDPEGSPHKEEVRIWDSVAGETRAVPQGIHNGYGTFTFRDDGTPLQLVWQREKADSIFLLWDMAEQKAFRRFVCPKEAKCKPQSWAVTPGGAFAGVLMMEPRG
jgi:hypothetical protein